MDFKNFSLAVSQTKVARFAAELAAGKIMSTVCARCGRKFYPPQSDCSACLSSDMEWRELNGVGTLATFTKIYVPPDHFAAVASRMPFSGIQFEPCPIGILEMEDGLRIMGWIPKVDMKKIRVGIRMKAVPQTLPDGRVTIVFEPIL